MASEFSQDHRCRHDRRWPAARRSEALSRSLRDRDEFEPLLSCMRLSDPTAMVHPEQHRRRLQGASRRRDAAREVREVLRRDYASFLEAKARELLDRNEVTIQTKSGHSDDSSSPRRVATPPGKAWRGAEAPASESSRWTDRATCSPPQVRRLVAFPRFVVRRWSQKTPHF